MLYIVFLLLGLSYLNPSSFLPWPNASQDFTTIFALFILSITQFYYNKKVEVSRIIFIIMVIVLLIPLFQIIIGVLYFKQEFFLSTLYISIFFLSIINGLNFNKITELSFLFVFVGLISVLIQILQWVDIYTSVFYMDIAYYRPSANLGQPNNLATLLFISLFSNLYLYLNKNIFKKIYIFNWIVLVFGIALTQSRTSWVVFCLLIVIVYAKNNLKIFTDLVKYGFVFVSFFLIIPYINNIYHRVNSTFIERMDSDYSRLNIWKQMLFSIYNYPWFGVGWNQSSVAQTKISLKYPFSMWIEYSHNLFLDLLVWGGVPLGICIIIAILSWLFFVNYRIKDSNDLILFIIIIAFFVHCMFEFPFAYAYFLLPIGLYVGLLTQKIFVKNLVSIKKMNLILIILVIFCTGLILKDYLSLSEKEQEYSSKYFFGQIITPKIDKLLVLDALDLKNDIQYLDACYVVKNRKIEDIEQVFYRYPSKINSILYYKSSLYNNKKQDAALSFVSWKYPNFSPEFVEINECFK